MFNTANDCTRLIIAVKGENLIRLSAKLEDHSTGPKTYWFILNRFLSNKKIPIIPAILVDDIVASNFAEKTEFFNSYFASQCTPVANKSQIPSLEFKMGKRIFYWWQYKPNNKESRWDKISIRLIKLCGKSIGQKKILYMQYMIYQVLNYKHVY